MTTTVRVVTGPGRSVAVHPGPLLLSGVTQGPSLAAHRSRHGDLRPVSLDELVAGCASVDVRGRGGAGFPFATKLSTAAASRGRPVVVVNLSEGEPASFKDSVLAITAPHLVLDGAAAAARALRARDVHVVLPGDRPAVRAAVFEALNERRGQTSRRSPLRFRTHIARTAFVAGQAKAVTELVSGRDNSPVTGWKPDAVSGVGGRPTLLSNGETFAHLGLLALHGARAYAALGWEREAGTTLLTLRGDTGAREVREVELGTPWRSVLSARDLEGPVLVGGYHGTWAAPGALTDLVVSRSLMTEHGLALGAGVVLPQSGCPVVRTAELTSYLAAESAQKCGPCFNGLPALAHAVQLVADGRGGPEEVRRLTGLVTGRGACAHPDGTARLVGTMLTAYGEEVDRHLHGRCGYDDLRRAG